jgi:hypothetical protein
MARNTYSAGGPAEAYRTAAFPDPAVWGEAQSMPSDSIPGQFARSHVQNKKSAVHTWFLAQIISLSALLENKESTFLDFMNGLAKAADIAESMGFSGARRWVNDIATAPLENIPANERQDQILKFLSSDFAKEQGVPMDLIGGVWGIETRFSTSGLKSPTGCAGDWQFSGGTFRYIMRDHGAELAAEARRDPELMKALEFDGISAERVVSALEKGATSVAGRDLRYHTEVATFGALKLLRREADSLGIKGEIPPERYGDMFAAYNIGGGGARDLIRKDKDGQSASALTGTTRTNLGHNPLFNGRTVSDIRGRYQGTITQRAQDFEQNFGDKLERLAQPDSPKIATFTAAATGSPSVASLADENTAEDTATAQEHPKPPRA